VLAPGLDVLFVGINPGLYSAAIGHHFGRPGNRFWPALHAGGFTPRVLSPTEDRFLPRFGLGLTNICPRTTARAEDLTSQELRHGAKRLARKVRRIAPRFVAVLGLSAYRTAFEQPSAEKGLQPGTIGSARVWVLPNPSGLNAHYQLADLGRLFGELRKQLSEGTAFLAIP
jgi:TDG/mug DNA glycosylase family protein